MNTMGLALRDHARHTYADYRKWPEDVRDELIDGLAYLMAGPDRAHQDRRRNPRTSRPPS